MTKRKPLNEHKKKGRPSLYSEAYADKAYKLCLLGATDVEMAGIFDCTESTFYLWKAQYPEFSEAITRGKVEADANVAERMYKRALGYSHEAVKIFMPAGADEPVYAPYTEHYPPDTQAASLWLRNRQPAKWRDKQEHEHTGPGGAALIPVLNVTIANPDQSAPAPETGSGAANDGN